MNVCLQVTDERLVVFFGHGITEARVDSDSGHATVFERLMEFDHETFAGNLSLESASDGLLHGGHDSR
jgi:hypothetical protein